MDPKMLLKVLNQQFSMNELRILCSSLDNVDFENLTGLTKELKALDLVEFLSRGGRLQSLVDKVAELRPNVTLYPEFSKLLYAGKFQPTKDFLFEHPDVLSSALLQTSDENTLSFFGFQFSNEVIADIWMIDNRRLMSLTDIHFVFLTSIDTDQNAIKQLVGSIGTVVDDNYRFPKELKSPLLARVKDKSLDAHKWLSSIPFFGGTFHIVTGRRSGTSWSDEWAQYRDDTRRQSKGTIEIASYDRLLEICKQRLNLNDGV